MATKEEIQDQTFKTLKFFEEERNPYEAEWQEKADLVLPRRALFEFAKSRRAERRTTKMYDGTAASAAVLKADGVQGYMTSQNIPWFKMLLVLLGESKRLADTSDVKRWLQDLEEIYYYLFQQSNFYDSIGELYLDLFVIETATMYVAENLQKNGLRFSARHPKEIFFACNDDGVPDTHFRKFYRNNKDLVSVFGKEKVGEEFAKQAEDRPYDQSLVLHTVFPRKDRDYSKSDKLNKPFASYYFLHDKKMLLAQSGYDSNPYITCRDRVNSDEKYGRGSTSMALSDIKRANQIAKAELDAAHKQTNPPVTYPGEMEDLDLGPGGENPYIDPSRRIYPVNTGTVYQVAKDMRESIQIAIREHYRVDFFLMLSQMVGQKMTATQVIEMQGEKAAILGTTISRISSELLDPIFDRVFDIIVANGWLPPMPAILQDYGGTKIRPDYIGPLAQAQKRYHATQGTLNALNQTMPFMEFFPRMRYAWNDVELGIHLAQAGGAPEKVLNDRRTIEALIQQEQQQMAAQQQLTALQQLSDTYNKSSKAPEGGSMAQTISDEAEEQLIGAA